VDAPDNLIPCSLAASVLGRPVDSVRREVIRGDLRGERRGSRWFVSLPALRVLLGERAEDPRAAS
jgi:hypothetical protein